MCERVCLCVECHIIIASQHRRPSVRARLGDATRRTHRYITTPSAVADRRRQLCTHADDGELVVCRTRNALALTETANF